MKKLILSAWITLITVSLWGYNNLYINDPQNWGRYEAQIDSAEIAVKHLGAFTEYQLTLSISAVQPINLSEDTQLEIVLDFELPDQSMITDSWLWIYGEPKQADILDRWTASAIYEEIVNRRKDPSLLVKNGINQYRISVYPMKPQESRVFKITYLTPSKYNNNELTLEIPDHIFSLPNKTIDSFDLYFLPTPSTVVPYVDNTQLEVKPSNHMLYGESSYATINIINSSSPEIKLVTEKPETVTSSYYQDEDQGYYSISFTPSDLINVPETEKHVCFVIDYDKKFTNLETSDLLRMLKGYIRKNLSSKDYINVVFSNSFSKLVYPGWSKATDNTIEQIFDNPYLASYSNMIPALSEAVKFTNSQEENGSIVLISNNAYYTDIEQANDIIQGLETLNEKNTPIHVIDYCNQYYNGSWTTTGSYHNSGYLFTNMARKNNGEYVSLFDMSTWQYNFIRLEEGISLTTSQKLENLDIYTRSSTGFCYGRMNFSNSISNTFGLDKMVNHIGKYDKTLPTTLELSFEYNNQFYHHELTLTEGDYMQSDTTLKTIYNGLDIFNKENQPRSNQIISEIINSSMDNRILSYYTAFLCVEDLVEDCENCGEPDSNDDDWGDDGGEMPTNSSENPVNSKIKVYPNPFSKALAIEVTDPDQLIEIRILDFSGRTLKTITADPFQEKYTIDTEEVGLLDAGFYFIQLIYNDEIVIKKVLKK